MTIARAEQYRSDLNVQEAQAELHERLLQTYSVPRTRPVTRRRPTREQGRALEILGHAVEYLIDTRMFYVEHADSKAEDEAARILTRASRELFSECAEVLSLSERFRRWIQEHLPTTVDGDLEDTHQPSVLQGL